MSAIFIVTGQTATGKTKYALKLAKEFNGELINCDSRQIYEKLNIVTGKDINLVKYFGAKIRLYDIISPKETFSAHDYREAAQKIIKEILRRAKTPVIVGGTYFYLQELLYERSKARIPPDWSLRKKLEGSSVLVLQQKLQRLSPEFFNSLNQSERNNPHRLIRKIEILSQNPSYKETGIKYEFSPFFSKMKIDITGIKFKKQSDLQIAIKKRVEERLKNGAIEEARQLIKQGFKESDPGLQTIGYKQIFKHLKGVLSLKAMTDEWVSHEIQYAKRQYTFIKTDPNIHWITV